MTRVHEVILASAGSGKTWQLTTRFLGLLADGVPPERVLATTFTRKAAGEIFSRLLARLAEAAADERELERLNADLKRPPGRALDRTGCAALLAGCARALDRFQVCTLDACFAELAGLFGLDVGLPPGWELVEEAEDDALRAEAVGAALAGAPAAELAELLAGLHGDRPRRSVHERVLQAVKDGYGKWLEQQDDEAWERAIRLPEALAPEEAAALPGRLAALEPPLTKAGKPSVKITDARQGLLEDLDRQQWPALLESRLVACALDGSGTFSSIALDDEWLDALGAVGRHAGRAVAARLLQRSRSQRQLLERFDAEYRRLQLERRALRFDDLPRALDGAAFDFDGPAAELRLGRRVEHLLLDEFQDTSVLQWRVLAPLARAILRRSPDERSFFCVGDVKQAIYAWREGESRLLRKLADGGCGPVSASPLSESYRSSPAVLALVNQVFASLPGNPALDAKPAYVRAAARWAEAFQAHRPAARCAALPGAARLIEVPLSGEKPGKDERTRQVMAAAAVHVRQLVREAPGCKLAVLLRRGARAAPLLYELARLGVPASAEGGNPLTDSAAVRLALSLLRLAGHPGDGAAVFHLATSPLAGALGLPPAARAGDEAVRALLRRVRAEV
ncbi:MAG TPA: UvrD-helicase domain-containing protein, partial [Planctomycetota bacterium]|nr:UvrD-helicase domain-containing protein [Planctomycetota bacterium]